ncbi:Os08g0141100 [Oryza sativa Japonica Group]|uniref:Os08g0141100 protein n=2 Tax=Oryza sativa subsp. japonica TaxID=39947 RepID=Q6ZJK0_ORYSJ|nr:hypothetical protein OsJ_25999 [Oryza sativa Japonica Group]BAD11588.1 hypothetical protein [Oryza sativa Japonica Group]BAD13175.1 hypothetical protein [Oryza sativa Japonica Group]BAT03784.1 Os08g0141100 [Oryza sativa Japonica Group]
MGCRWRRTRSLATSSGVAAGVELPAWHGCGWRTQPLRRRAPAWCGAWTAEDMAAGDEPGEGRGGRGRDRQQQAWCGAWQQRTRPSATSSDVGRGRRRMQPSATTSDMRRGQRRTRLPAMTPDIGRGGWGHWQ